MSRIKTIAGVAAFVGAAALTAPVAAQDGPTMTIDPTSVPAAGEQKLTISGEGFTVADIFVVPCEGASTLEELANAGDGACDLTALTPATVTDGAFSVEITYDIPEGGMCFAGGDIGQVETSGVCITVGEAMTEMTDTKTTSEEMAPSDDKAASEEMTASETEKQGTEKQGTEDMANTGINTTQQLLIAGGLLIVAGAAFVGRRRLAD